MYEREYDSAGIKGGYCDQIWSPKILIRFYQTIPGDANSDYSGEIKRIGDTVRFSDGTIMNIDKRVDVDIRKIFQKWRPVHKYISDYQEKSPKYDNCPGYGSLNRIENMCIYIAYCLAEKVIEQDPPPWKYFVAQMIENDFRLIYGCI